MAGVCGWRSRSGRLTAGLLMLLVLLTGCQAVTTTTGGSVGVAREQWMLPLLSDEQVDELSEQSYRQLQDKARQEKNLLSKGPQLMRLQAIADRIIAQTPVFRSDTRSWPWQVVLVRSPAINASCLPNGRIVFFTGIIDTLKLSDDEIAAIMGHEIAHALREHGREAMSEAYVVQLGGSLAGAVLGAPRESLDIANTVVHYAMTLPNSREKESEADIIGLELMARAGYNPKAAITLWQKMSAQGGRRPPEFASTHPAIATRITGIRHYLPRVMPLYKKATKTD